LALGCGSAIAAGAPTLDGACPNPNALGTSRTLVVDPDQHLRVGGMQYPETLPLADHEVVLTFDDGPLPPYSTRILDILASQCVKATYFLVGSMAHTYPHVVTRIAAEGHSIGTHSQTHPLTFNRMELERAQHEIQGGIASVTAALGGHAPAPFFRIPGLLRASAVENYLASQHIMTWSADIPSDDWRHISDKEIVRRTLARLEQHGRGIILMHDIHPATALALPVLLRELKARGYHVVHVVPASSAVVRTATLPDDWLVHHGHHPTKDQDATQHAETKPDLTPTATIPRHRLRSHRPPKRHHMAHRPTRAGAAVVPAHDAPTEERRWRTVEHRDSGPSGFFSAVLRFPRELLQ
jgi:peptidoglycan/xylan/chitin deacetylase (PgdA/CDA1 family)